MPFPPDVAAIAPDTLVERLAERPLILWSVAELRVLFGAEVEGMTDDQLVRMRDHACYVASQLFDMHVKQLRAAREQGRP